MRNALIGRAGLFLLMMTSAATAQGTLAYVGQTIVIATNFCPQGWAPMNGQLLSIAENDTLFALIGTNYGGDGQNNFALPRAEPIVTANGATLTQCISLFGAYPSRN